MITYDEITEKLKSTLESNGFHMIDITNPGGYFIFENDGIRHFHIKECPNFKFAVWYSQDEDKDNITKGEFFGQYEPEIDKFKPTRSSFNVEFYYEEEDDYLCGVEFQLIPWLIFIKKHPIKAWGMDYCGYNYTTSCSKSVLYEYIEYKIKTKYRSTLSNILDKIALKALIKATYNCTDPEEELYLSKDVNRSPKYIIYSITLGEEEPGAYDFLSDEEKAKLEKVGKTLKKIGNNIWWYPTSSIANYIELLNPEHFDEYIEDCKEFGEEIIKLERNK